MNRPSWEEYFMEIVKLVAKRATCLRRKVGAAAVRNKRILATGYNGAPMGVKHCIEVGCLREKLGVPSGQRFELCRGVHAEENCVAQAAYYGISLNGAAIYVTNFPCLTCSKLLINAGIKEIFYSDFYDDEMAQEILKEARIKLVNFKKRGGKK